MTGAAAALLIFLAGFGGVAAEVVWARWFATVYGGTAPAAAAVLCSYLGGLALGGAWLGRRADSVRCPRRMAGALQLGAGAATAALLAVPALLPPLYGAALKVSDSPLWLGVSRFGLAGLFLLVPAVLHGGTLPATVCWVRRSRDGSAASPAGALRAAGCLGAALGALASAGWLIPVLGLGGTALCAASVCAAAGALAMLPSGRTGLEPAAPQRGARSGRRGASDFAESAGGRAGAAPAVRAAVFLAALVGAVTLSAEVAHMRAAAFLAGGTIRTFAALSAVYIAGLGLGSAAGALLAARAGRDGALSALAAVLALAAAALGLSMAFPGLWRPGEGALWRAGLCCLPAAAALGAAFPLLVAALEAPPGCGPAGAGRAVGLASAALEAGSAAGPILAALVLLPLLGTAATLAAAAGGAALAGVWLVLRSRRAGDGPRRPGPVVRWLVIAALPCAALPAMGAGLYARAVLGEAGEESEVKPALESLDEGPEAVVSVLSMWRAEEGRRVRALYIGRKMQADDSTPWLRIEKGMGVLPALLCPLERGRTFHLGLGSGVSAAWSAAAAPGRTVEVAEIVPGVAAELEAFSPHNAAGRFAVRLGDGRAMLAAEDGRFGLIVTDIVFPEDAGAGGLFSAEYFRLARSRLEPGGVFAHWLPLWQLSPDALRSTVRAFLDAFPDGTLWAVSLNAGRPLVALVGTGGGVGDASPPAALARRIAAAGGPGGRLSEIGMDSPEAVLARFVAGPDGLRELAGAARPSTDDRPTAELSGPARGAGHHGPANLAMVLAAWAADIPNGLPGAPVGADVLGRAADLRKCRRALAEVNLELAGAAVRGLSDDALMAAAGRVRPARAGAPRDPEIAYELWGLLAEAGAAATAAGDMASARALLEESLTVGPERDYIMRHLALALAVSGQRREGLEKARRACALVPGEAANWSVLEQVAASAGEREESARAAARAAGILRSGRTEPR